MTSAAEHYALTTLRDVMLLGRFPEGWSPSAIAQAGEKLREALAMAVDGESFEDEVRRAREILTNFGALAPDDDVTGACDLLEILLPPAGA